jgi:hypothetical protein
MRQYNLMPLAYHSNDRGQALGRIGELLGDRAFGSLFDNGIPPQRNDDSLSVCHHLSFRQRGPFNNLCCSKERPNREEVQVYHFFLHRQDGEHYIAILYNYL